MAILVDTQIRNNLYATGSIWAGAGYSGSVYGTSSWADSATLASTASTALRLVPNSSSYASASTLAYTASYTLTLAATTPFSAAADSTYYFGAQFWSNFTGGPTDNYVSFDSMSVEIPQPGKLRRAFLKYYCTPTTEALVVTASIMSGSTPCGSGSFIPTSSVCTMTINRFISASVDGNHPLALRLQTPSWASPPTVNTLYATVYINAD